MIDEFESAVVVDLWRDRESREDICEALISIGLDWCSKIESTDRVDYIDAGFLIRAGLG